MDRGSAGAPAITARSYQINSPRTFGMTAYTLSFAPIGMNRRTALAYTGVSEEQMRRWQREGTVRFLSAGPRGQLITTRAMLDAATFALFDGLEADENFEFAD